MVSPVMSTHSRAPSRGSHTGPSVKRCPLDTCSTTASSGTMSRKLGCAASEYMCGLRAEELGEAVLRPGGYDLHHRGVSFCHTADPALQGGTQLSRVLDPGGLRAERARHLGQVLAARPAQRAKRRIESGLS